MGGKLGRKFAVVVIASSSLATLAVVVPSASAYDPNGQIYRFRYNIDATTHMKTLDQTITITGGLFKGGIDFASQELRGDITLPPATFTFKAAGLVPLITATAKIVPTKRVTGTVDFDALTVTATSTFLIKIKSAYVAGTTSPNLVGTTCQTIEPIVVTMSGPVSFGSASTFSGGFTMPAFKGCGPGTTTALTVALSGPGNTFSATATP